MIEAAVLIFFVVLAIGCLSVFGVFGIIPWLLIFGLFQFLGRALIRHIGDESDV